MRTLLQDVRYGLRNLARNPGFTLVAMLTLALGIGANTTIFSVIDNTLLKPLPFPGADRLLLVWETFGKGPDNWNIVSAPNFWDFERQSHSFETMAIFDSAGRGDQYVVKDGHEPPHEEQHRHHGERAAISPAGAHLRRHLLFDRSAWGFHSIFLANRDLHREATLGNAARSVRIGGDGGALAADLHHLDETPGSHPRGAAPKPRGCSGHDAHVRAALMRGCVGGMRTLPRWGRQMEAADGLQIEELASSIFSGIDSWACVIGINGFCGPQKPFIPITHAHESI